MAICSATTEGERSCTGAATKTILEIMGDADVVARLVEFGVSFDGVTPTDAPVIVELYQITASGTGTAATEVAWDRSAKTIQCAVEYNSTVEPTKGSRLAIWEVHPQAGSLVVQYPLGREPVITNGSASQGLAVVVTPAVTVNAVGYLVWDE